MHASTFRVVAARASDGHRITAVDGISRDAAERLRLPMPKAGWNIIVEPSSEPSPRESPEPTYRFTAIRRSDGHRLVLRADAPENEARRLRESLPADGKWHIFIEPEEQPNELRAG